MGFPEHHDGRQPGQRAKSIKMALSGVLSAAVFVKVTALLLSWSAAPTIDKYDANVLQHSIDMCKAAHAPAGPPPAFHKRTRSARHFEDSAPILLRNLTIWTGKPSNDPKDFGEVLRGKDVLIDNGLIVEIGESGEVKQPSQATVIHGHGKWLTPGIIDVHVHAGASTTPAFGATDDVNSLVGPTQPYLRVVDGLHPHDVGLASIASGGVTTGLMLPGSANSMGGQAYPIKMGRQNTRQVRDGAWNRVIEPPLKLVLPGQGNRTRDEMYASDVGMRRGDDSSSWRYLKMACGENPRRIYKQTRMDEAYHFRTQFTNARKLLREQDSFCNKVMKFDGKTETVPAGDLQTFTFPDDLDLEALVDVLRGKTKVNTHCYTMEDFTSFVSITNEFKFQLAAFHHAHEAYLVPDLLRNVYGGAPAVALFSLQADYKVEASFGTPFAAAILTDEGIRVHIKSDHPVTDSRRLIVQVAQAHHYGFPAGAALRAVTSGAANSLGLDHRIGQVKKGMDADVVLWDRHPLSLGASPLEVVIDGYRQALHIDDSLQQGIVAPQHVSESLSSDDLEAPFSANYTHEIELIKHNYPAIVANEMPPYPVPKRRADAVLFRNVALLYELRPSEDDGRVRVTEVLSAKTKDEFLSVLVEKGTIQRTCSNQDESCLSMLPSNIKQVDLRGGSIIPGLIAVHPTLGNVDIQSEKSAKDGDSNGQLSGHFSRAEDGLILGGPELRRAATTGIRTVVVAPSADDGIAQGIYTHFDAGSMELLDQNTIRKRDVGLLVLIRTSNKPSVSECIGSLTEALQKAKSMEDPKTYNEMVYAQVVGGSLPLIIDAASAEIITRVIQLKDQFPELHLVIRTASEAAFGRLPKLLKERNVGVLIDPIRFPSNYDQRRSFRIDGVYANDVSTFIHTNHHYKSLSAGAADVSAGQHHAHIPSVLGVLHRAGVRVAVMDSGVPANSFLWDTIEAGGKAGLSRADTLDLAVGRVADVLDITADKHDLVAFEGNVFDYGARPVAMTSVRGVDLMD